MNENTVMYQHHGHMNCSMEVYAEIMPEACMWCALDWLYAEPEVPAYLADAEKLRRMGRIRMYGTAGDEKMDGYLRGPKALCHKGRNK